MGSLNDLRKRLEELNRKPLPDVRATKGARKAPVADGLGDLRRKMAKRRAAKRRATPVRMPDAPAAPRLSPILYRRDLPRAEQKAAPAMSESPVELVSAVSGTEVRCPRWGKAFLVAHQVRELEDEAAALCEGFRRALVRGSSNVRRWLAALCEVEELELRDMMFVDLETTGLSCTPLFLIGTMVWEDAGLVVRQYFARNYAEEAAVISLFLDRMAEKKVLVSFNGKTFDLPYVRVRAVANAIPFAVDARHLDLLQVSRRVWKGKVPNCRLQTLERCVCGRTRFGDIPGSEIPQAYHDFVRTADARVMVEVLRHNMLDLVTLADLMVRLPAPG